MGEPIEPDKENDAPNKTVILKKSENDDRPLNSRFRSEVKSMSRKKNKKNPKATHFSTSLNTQPAVKQRLKKAKIKIKNQNTVR